MLTEELSYSAPAGDIHQTLKHKALPDNLDQR